MNTRGNPSPRSLLAAALLGCAVPGDPATAATDTTGPGLGPSDGSSSSVGTTRAPVGSDDGSGGTTTDTGDDTSTGDGPPTPPLCHAEQLPFVSALTYPDHTRWGDNMHKIGRLGDRVFTFWSDNSGYCQPNAPPGTRSCPPGESGLSYLRVLRKDGPDLPFTAVQSLAFPTVRPGNLLVSPGCVHAFVFEPHPQATRALDRFGGLKHYWFPPDVADGESADSEWVELPPPGALGPETVNLRIGASIATDGRMVAAWGLPDGTMNVRVRDGAACSPGSWTSAVAEQGLEFGYMYPRVHVAGGGGQQYYTGIVAQMDEQTPTLCAGGPPNGNGDSIYRRANYWEDSRNGAYRRETVVDLWDPCGEYTRVNHTEMYIDRASNAHVIFAKLIDGGTAELEHWTKPGDSFATDPAFDQAAHCDDAVPCQWTAKLTLDWAALGINWVRLFEVPGAGGESHLYYVASSWDRAFVGRVDGLDQGAEDLIELVLPSGWRDALAGTGLFISGAGGGTDVATSQLDIMLPGAEVTYVLRLDKLALDAAYADDAVPPEIACVAP